MNMALEGCVFKDSILQPRQSFQVQAAADQPTTNLEGSFHNP